MYIKCENLKIVRTLFLPNQSKGKQRLARTHTEIGRSRRKFSVKLKWQLFLVREKVTGLSCTNHKMPLNFPFSSQREAWHWLSTQMVQKFSFVSVKAGEKKYQMEWFIQAECVLCRIFAYKFRQSIAMRLCSLLGTFATALC